MLDAIIISDIHLGSDVCQAEALDKFLKKIDKLQPQRIIVNGDLFDCLNFNKLPKHHWHILKDLRKLSKKTEVIWLNGNHSVKTGNSKKTFTTCGFEAIHATHTKPNESNSRSL